MKKPKQRRTGSLIIGKQQEKLKPGKPPSPRNVVINHSPTDFDSERLTYSLLLEENFIRFIYNEGCSSD